MKQIYLVALLLVANAAHADITNCSDVYVGMILVEKGGGLSAVTFHNSPTDQSGSNYQYFSTGWSADDKKAALAVLTAAKLSQHRVNVATEAAGECSITSGWHVMKSVVLAAAP